MVAQARPHPHLNGQQATNVASRMLMTMLAFRFLSESIRQRLLSFSFVRRALDLPLTYDRVRALTFRDLDLIDRYARKERLDPKTASANVTAFHQLAVTSLETGKRVAPTLGLDTFLHYLEQSGELTLYLAELGIRLQAHERMPMKSSERRQARREAVKLVKGQLGLTQMDQVVWNVEAEVGCEVSFAAFNAI